jgi:hypothetical protein
MAFGSEESALSIVVRLKDEASKELDKFRGKVEKMQPAFQKMAVAGVAAFAGITAVATKSVTAYAEVERAQRQLEHAIVGVSKGTSAQVEEVQKLTAALQKKAGVDADSLNMGVAQLSTFGLQTQSVINLTKSLADFTVNQNGLNASADQYIDSANTIAKALNGQFGVLERSGIRFTEHQQAMIKNGTEAEKVAALQEGLAQNLRETTDTVAGVDLAMAKFSRTTEDISENIGRALVPAFGKLMEKIQPVVERFAAWTEANPELAGKILMVSAAVAALVAGVGLLGMALPAVITGVSLLLSPVGLLIAAIMVGLIPAVKYIREHFGELRERAMELWEAFKGSPLVDALRFAFDQLKVALSDSLIPALKNMWEILVQLAPILQPLAQIILTVVVGALSAFVGILSVVLRVVAQVIETLSSLSLAFTKYIVPPVKSVIDLFKEMVDWIAKAIDKLNVFDKAKKTVDSVANFLSKTGSTVKSKTSNLLKFETGGTVPGPEGMPVPIIAHGQETILPARKSGGGTGGNTFVVNFYNPQVPLDNTEYFRKQLEQALRDVSRVHKLTTI